MKRRALALLAAGLGLASCDKKIDYTYFNVAVTLERESVDDELLDLVNACGAVAQIDERRDSTNLRCVRHQVSRDLGVFQYTTSRTAGSVTFTVTLLSYWGSELATGQSTPVGVAPGSTTDVSLVVKGIPGAPRMPPSGGSVDAAPVAGDAAADAAVAPLDAPADAPDDGPASPPDAGVDAAPTPVDAAVDSAIDVAVDSAVDVGPDAAPDATPVDSGTG